MRVNRKVGECLVIGANGFIGSHLVDDLTAKGYKVKALDRFSTSPRFKITDDIEIIKGSSFEPKLLKSALKGINYVFLSMSATTPYTSDNDPYIDIQKNLVHNVEIIEKSVKAKVKKVIFISSGGAVYGNIAEETIVSEKDAPQPISPYGINKLATEYYLEYFKRKYGLEYIVYRLTNPYGPRQVMRQNHGVIPAFINCIMRGEELLVYGDGKASRDYIYICDATRMIVGSFAQDNKQEVYNLGSGKQTSLITIIKTIEKIMGVKTNYRCVEAPKTFLEKTMVSNLRFINEFGFKPKTSLEEGLKTMLGDLLPNEIAKSNDVGAVENLSESINIIPNFPAIAEENIELAL